MTRFKVGDFIIHATQPAWGAGKVTVADSVRMTVVFPGDGATAAPSERRYKVDFAPLGLAPDQAAAQLAFDAVLPARRASKQAGARKVQQVVKQMTFEEALRSFQSHYTNFNDPRYIGSKKEGERVYKELAAKSFQELLGADRLRSLVSDRNALELRLALREVQQPVSNLLHSTEVSRLSEAERNDEACISYGAALDDLLRAETLNEQVFERYVRAAKLFVDSAKSGGRFTWPLATFFPYLADPDRFIFFKPNISRAWASRMQFELMYDSRPNWQTYERILLLSNDLLERLWPLGARDFIDVQSFMFIVESYETESGTNKP
jgi:hypothetical protein